jgi:thiamin-phosphate kinase
MVMGVAELMGCMSEQSGSESPQLQEGRIHPCVPRNVSLKCCAMNSSCTDRLLIDVGEFSLHDWIRNFLPRHPLDRVGLGDDCVAIEIDNRYMLITTDRVPLSAYKRSHDYVGRLCVQQNFSDIICKGGLPIGMLLGTYVPRETRLTDWQSIVRGAQETAAQYNASILGGDTKEAPDLCVTGCAVGFVEKDRFVQRSSANHGDVICLTLKRGFKIGLPWVEILSGHLKWNLPIEEFDWLQAEFMKQNLCLPFQETRAATEFQGVTSSIDTSDGVGGALHLIIANRELGIELDYAALRQCIDPRVNKYAERLAVDPIKFAFTPGHIWENVMTVDPSLFTNTQQRVRSVGGDLVRIGEITDDSQSVLIRRRNEDLRPLALFYNEGFRKDRRISNDTTAWIEHTLIL